VLLFLAPAIDLATMASFPLIHTSPPGTIVAPQASAGCNAIGLRRPESFLFAQDGMEKRRGDTQVGSLGQGEFVKKQEFATELRYTACGHGSPRIKQKENKQPMRWALVLLPCCCLIRGDPCPQAV
jgi:hypothetical protein